MDRNNVKYKMYNNQENGDTNENGNDSSNSIYKKLVNYFAIMDQYYDYKNLHNDTKENENKNVKIL